MARRGPCAARGWLPLLAAVAVALVGGCREPTRVVEGVASFYHDSLDRSPTANAEEYRARYFTAAHRSLPFGTRVRVTHLGNGRSVWVRINDRGPFVEGRVIDLSRAAAKKLNMTDSGLARVRLEIYEEDP